MESLTAFPSARKNRTEPGFDGEYSYSLDDIPLREVVEQISQHIPLHIRTSIPDVTVNIVETLSAAAERLRAEKPTRQAFIDLHSRHHRRLVRRSLRQTALEYCEAEKSSATGAALENLSLVENKPPSTRATLTTTPERATKEVRAALRRMALADRTNLDPYLVIPVALADPFIPRLDVKIRLNGIDDDEYGWEELFELVPAYLDTGAHITLISADRLAATFWSYLRTDPINAPYRIYHARMEMVACQVDMVLDIPALRSHTFTILAKVIPREMMPNGFSGVLLGQHTFLDRLEYTMKPWAVLDAFGERDSGAAEQRERTTWGQIDFKRWVDSVGQKVEFGRDA